MIFQECCFLCGYGWGVNGIEFIVMIIKKS
jgi:hypothetical protein